jgi:hypothetical protein
VNRHAYCMKDSIEAVPRADHCKNIRRNSYEVQALTSIDFLLATWPVNASHTKAAKPPHARTRIRSQKTPASSKSNIHSFAMWNEQASNAFDMIIDGINRLGILLQSREEKDEKYEERIGRIYGRR